MNRDTVISGSLAGMLANIPKTIGAWVFYQFGLTEYTFEQIAAAFLTPLEFIHTPVGVIIGLIADFTVAALVGVIFFLLLRYTGTDHALLKGLLGGALAFVFGFGLVMFAGLTRALVVAPLPLLIYFLLHLLFGAVATWHITRFSLAQKT